MKNRTFTLLVVAPLILASCGGGTSSSDPAPSSSSSSSSSAAPQWFNTTVNVKMVSHFRGDSFGEGEYEDSCRYDDHWFVADSFVTNPELALFSAMAGGAAYSNGLDNKGDKIKNLLTATGFSDIAFNTYFAENLTLKDSIGAVIGKKTIKDEAGKDFTLLAVLPRSAGYGHEWFGNFDMGETGMHKGFKQARDEMLRFMKYYVDANHITGKVKVWSAGYSRGAAVTNLLGGFLAEDNGYFGKDFALDPHDVYVYNIGTPRSVPNGVSKKEVLSVSGPRGEGFDDTNIPAYLSMSEGNIDLSQDKYKGIHNVVATGDYVTKLPFEEWGFSRYGQTEEILYGDKAMLDNLKKLSPETAAMFEGGMTYAKARPTKAIDFQNFAITDGTTSISTNGLIDQRLAALKSLAGTREEAAGKGYADLLGAATSIYGVGIDGFINGITSDIGAIVKAAVLNLFAYFDDSLGLGGAKSAASALMDFIELFGKTIEDRATYTDQMFLADLLDILINDYQTSEAGERRGIMLSFLIPAPYGAFYGKLLNFAKDNDLQPHTVEELLELLAKYAFDHKDDEVIVKLIDMIGGVIPEGIISSIGSITHKTYDDETYPTPEAKGKAAASDILDLCVLGVYDDEGVQSMSPETFRNTLLMVVGFVLKHPVPHLLSLIQNSAMNPLDPALFDVTVGEIIDTISPVDEEENPLPLDEAAAQSLIELLEKGRTEANADYIDMFQAHPAEAREMIVTLFLNPGETFNLQRDINNAFTFVDALSFIAPAHYHEMYISFLKTKVAN